MAVDLAEAADLAAGIRIPPQPVETTVADVDSPGRHVDIMAVFVEGSTAGADITAAVDIMAQALDSVSASIRPTGTGMPRRSAILRDFMTHTACGDCIRVAPRLTDIELKTLTGGKALLPPSMGYPLTACWSRTNEATIHF